MPPDRAGRAGLGGRAGGPRGNQCPSPPPAHPVGPKALPPGVWTGGGSPPPQGRVYGMFSINRRKMTPTPARPPPPAPPQATPWHQRLRQPPAPPQATRWQQRRRQPPAPPQATPWKQRRRQPPTPPQATPWQQRRRQPPAPPQATPWRQRRPAPMPPARSRPAHHHCPRRLPHHLPWTMQPCLTTSNKSAGARRSGCVSQRLRLTHRPARHCLCHHARPRPRPARLSRRP